MTTAMSLLSIIAGVGIIHAQDKKPITFTGGASNIQETFENWTVSCGIQDDKKVCSLNQQQFQNNGQRIVAVEILPSATDGRINLVMPFGLNLAKGVSYRFDNDNSNIAAFQTCLIGGCISKIPLTNDLVASLKNSQNLILLGKTYDTNQDITLTISLKGFSFGFERTIALQK